MTRSNRVTIAQSHSSTASSPDPGRAPRRKKRPLKAELISRLKRLEDEIKGLKESTEVANRVNWCLCSWNAVRLEENGAGGQRERLIFGGGFSRYVMHDALVNVEDQVRRYRIPTISTSS